MPTDYNGYYIDSGWELGTVTSNTATMGWEVSGRQCSADIPMGNGNVMRCGTRTNSRAPDGRYLCSAHAAEAQEVDPDKE